MIQIAFLACSILHGSVCKDVNLTFHTESLTVFECMKYGQFSIAKWQKKHPNWHIMGGYKCGPPSKFAKI